AHHLDEALDHVVDPAAVIAGDAAEREADHEAHGDAEEAHGERDARAIHDAGKYLAPEPVGAEEIERAALRRAEEVEAAVDYLPEAVFVAEAEEAHLVDLRRVVGVLAPQRFQVELHVVAVDERP